MNKSRISNLKNLIAKRRSRFLQTEAKVAQPVSEAVGMEAQQVAETPAPVEPEVPALEESAPTQDIGIASGVATDVVEASTETPAEPAVEVVDAPIDVVDTPVETPAESAPTEAESLLVVEDGEAAVGLSAEEQPVVKRRRRKVKEAN